MIYLASESKQQTATRTEELLIAAGFTVQSCTVESLEGGLPLEQDIRAVVVDLAGTGVPDRYRTIQRAVRAASAPVLVTGGAEHGDALLEYAAAGALDHLPSSADADQLRAAVLITHERWQLEMELRRSYGGFRKLFNEAPVAVALADGTGTITRVNPAFLELTGYSASEFGSLSVDRLTYGDDQATTDLFRQLAAGEREHYRVRKRLVRRDGTPVWVELMASALTDPLSHERFYMAEIQNVDAEMAAKQALDQSETRYRNLFYCNPVPTLLLDLETMRFVTANRAAEEVYGYSAREFAGLCPEDIWTGDDQQGRLRALLKGQARIGPVRVRHRKKSAEEIDVELVSVRVDGEDKPTRLILARDVTVHRELDAALERAFEENAIRSLTGALAQALEQVTREAALRCDRLLQTAAASLDEAEVQGLRRLSLRAAYLARPIRSVTGTGHLEPEAEELNAAVAQRLEVLHGLLGDEVELSFHPLPGELPVWLAPAVLDHALYTLLTGTRRERVEVFTTRLPEQKVAVLTYRSFATRGRGAEEEILAERGFNMATGAFERLVHRSGGELRVERRADTTTVRIEFPLRDGREHSPQQGSAGTPAEVQQHSVLVVDDDAAVRYVMSEMLERAGFRVVAAPSSLEGLELGRDLPTVDILVADANLTLPHVTDLIRQLRQHHPDLRTLIVSGYLDDVLSALGDEDGDIPFLAKPFSASQLVSRVEALLTESCPP